MDRAINMHAAASTRSRQELEEKTHYDQKTLLQLPRTIKTSE